LLRRKTEEKTMNPEIIRVFKEEEQEIDSDNFIIDDRLSAPLQM